MLTLPRLQRCAEHLKIPPPKNFTGSHVCKIRHTFFVIYLTETDPNFF
jgi:hypothetical protein